MVEDKTPDEAVKDKSPALADVAPEFDTPEMAKAFEDVDFSTMPPFKEMKRMLPAQRFHVKRVIAEIGQSVTADFGSAGDDLTAEQLAATDEMMSKAQAFVLDMAEDEDDMKAWLMSQESGESALMAAFATVAKTLGN